MKGTVVSAPHSEQVVRVSGRTLCVPRTRFALHCLQCLGSFLNCLSWKKTCSPAVNMKSAPQSVHLSTRSWNSIFGRLPLNRDARRTRPFGRLAGPGSLLSFVVHNKGPVRTKIERHRSYCLVKLGSLSRRMPIACMAISRDPQGSVWFRVAPMALFF